MTLNDWKEQFPAIARALENAKSHGRTGQAYLLNGDNDGELERFARGWAMTAACTGSAANGAACGVCSNCRHFLGNTYSECFVLEPQSKSRIITIDSVREFNRKITLSSPPGMLKVGIILSAECMGIEAQNSFLKTLEEPPRNTMLLLTTTRARLLLPTIRSRCQNILLLKNKVDYSSEVPEDFLKILARMHRNAGSRAAFDCVEKINVFLHSIREKAEEYVEENWDGAWDAVAENDRSIQKQLAEMKLTRVETEYLRRRNVLLECLSAWFQQRALQAAGAARLPQPEFIPFMQDIPVSTPDEAEEDLRSVTMFLKALNANVTEDIAIYALCLEICRKKR